MRFDQTLGLLKESDPARGMPPTLPVDTDRTLESIIHRISGPAPVASPPQRRRRRLRPLLATVTGSAAAVAIAVLLLTGTPTGTRSAWANEVVVRATAFLHRGINHALYTDVITIARPGGPTARTVSGQAVTWQYGTEMAETTWSLRPRRREIEDTVVRGRKIATFIAANNTIRESLNPPGRISYSPLLMPLMGLSPILVQRLHLTPMSLATAGPKQASKLMIALLHTRGVHVKHATLHGEPMIRLTDTNWSGSIYLNPRTYAPREIYWTHAPGTTKFGDETVIINSYRAIKPSQLPRNVFNVSLRHPTATVQHAKS